MNLDYINGTYRLQRKIASGTFGDVFLANDILLGQDVVIKLEPMEGSPSYLEHEYDVYQKLSRGIGIPHIRWFGTEGGFNVIALDFLGPSLDDLFVRCCFKFSQQTILCLADQLLCRLQHVHSRNFIHRDIKPGNIVMGIGTQSTVVYLIDFGLSKEYQDPNTYEHIPCKTNLGLTRTATFASINSHLGLELGRQDDLESLTYVLIYFLRGNLPWLGLPYGSWDIFKCKQRTMPSDLCSGLPSEFSTFLEYSRSLSFNDCPDYTYIRNLFNDLSSREGSRNDEVFDWDRVDNVQLQKQRNRGENRPASDSDEDRGTVAKTRHDVEAKKQRRKYEPDSPAQAPAKGVSNH
ncbi:kinase-like domain-containing protein [Lactarius quietus]|nr:kinase-like domain-containing protein [Lactarius quietus]